MKLLWIAGGIGLCLSMFSCKKENGPLQPPPASTAATPFEVKGVTPILFQQYPFGAPLMASQLWSVVYNKGIPKRVELSFAGLPAGMYDSLSVRGGYPDFTTNFLLINKGVPAGKYAAELLATGAGDTAPQRYPMPIEVKGTTSCAGYFAGLTMTTNNPCFSGSFRDYTVTFSQPDPNSDTLLMHNFIGDGRALKVVFHCDPYDIYKSTISSATQNFGDTTYRIEGRVILELTAPPVLPSSIRCTIHRKIPVSPPFSSCEMELNIQK